MLPCYACILGIALVLGQFNGYRHGMVELLTLISNLFTIILLIDERFLLLNCLTVIILYRNYVEGSVDEE